METITVPYYETNAIQLLSHRLKECIYLQTMDREVVVLCIGTDRSTGDALGPLIGSKLTQFKSFPLSVYGTLDEPVHALNLVDKIKQIEQSHHSPYIVAIDACLGRLKNVGMITLKQGALRPGAGVNKDLPAVGDLQITGNVNVGGFMEFLVLQNTRLSLVMKMADVIASSLMSATHDHRRYQIQSYIQSPLF